MWESFDSPCSSLYTCALVFPLVVRDAAVIVIVMSVTWRGREFGDREARLERHLSCGKRKKSCVSACCGTTMSIIKRVVVR